MSWKIPMPTGFASQRCTTQYWRYNKVITCKNPLIDKSHDDIDILPRLKPWDSWLGRNRLETKGFDGLTVARQFVDAPTKIIVTM